MKFEGRRISQPLSTMNSVVVHVQLVLLVLLTVFAPTPDATADEPQLSLDLPEIYRGVLILLTVLLLPLLPVPLTIIMACIAWNKPEPVSESDVVTTLHYNPAFQTPVVVLAVSEPESVPEPVHEPEPLPEPEPAPEPQPQPLAMPRPMYVDIGTTASRIPRFDASRIPTISKRYTASTPSRLPCYTPEHLNLHDHPEITPVPKENRTTGSQSLDTVILSCGEPWCSWSTLSA